MVTEKPLLTSKKRITPESGVISGLLVSWKTNKELEPVTLTIETVGGTFEGKVPRTQRSALKAELELGKPVRVWLRSRPGKVKIQLCLPLEPKQVLVTGPEEACIWVCTSKSCGRKGGQELLASLREAAQTCETRLEIRKSDCLGACKRGPTLKVRGHKKIHQVEPKTVPQWLETVLRSTN